MRRRKDRADIDVTLYTRAGCHLCDQAREVLERHGLHPQLVDIDRDPQLKELYDVHIPVVLIDRQERFRGEVNEVLLKRILRRR